MQQMINIHEYLSKLKTALIISTNWEKIDLKVGWNSKIPSEPGVYALKEDQEIVYVGETGNLKGRMKDLLDSRNHSVRRSLGKLYFSKVKEFKPATTSIKFPEHIEIMVNEYICKNLMLSYLVVELGRKELEEYIEKDLKEELKLNKRGKRKS